MFPVGLACRQRHENEVVMAFAQAPPNILEYSLGMPCSVEDLIRLERDVVILFTKPLMLNA